MCSVVRVVLGRKFPVPSTSLLLLQDVPHWPLIASFPGVCAVVHVSALVCGQFAGFLSSYRLYFCHNKRDLLFQSSCSTKQMHCPIVSFRKTSCIK